MEASHCDSDIYLKLWVKLMRNIQLLRFNSEWERLFVSQVYAEKHLCEIITV